MLEGRSSLQSIRRIDGGGPDVARARLEDGREAIVRFSEGSLPTQEFALLCEVDHPGIPRVLDCGVQDGRFWFAVEPIRGQVLEQGWPSGRDPVAFATAAAQVLIYLNACGARHGDVHPGSLVVPDAGFPCVMIDFGYSPPGDAGPCGRPGFVAPEVMRGVPRGLGSDLFGLALSLKRRHANGLPIVQRFIDAGLSGDPEERIRAAEELAASRPRPVCGARFTGRGEARARLVSFLGVPDDPVRLVQIRGGEGAGKSALLRRIHYEARARGWHVAQNSAESTEEMIWNWNRAWKPLLILLDSVDRLPNPAAVLQAVERLRVQGGRGLLVVASAPSELPGAWDRIDLDPLRPVEIANVFLQAGGMRSVHGLDEAGLALQTSGLPGSAESAARVAGRTGALRFQFGRWELLSGSMATLPRPALEAAALWVSPLPVEERRLLAASGLARGVLPQAALMDVAEASHAAADGLLASGKLRRVDGVLVPTEAASGAASATSLEADALSRLRSRIADAAAAHECSEDLVAEFRLEARDFVRGPAAARAAAQKLLVAGRTARRRGLLELAARVTPEKHEERGWIELELMKDDAGRRPTPEMAEESLRRARNADCPGDLRRGFLALAIGVETSLRAWSRLEGIEQEFASEGGVWLRSRIRLARAVEACTAGNLRPARDLVAEVNGDFASASEAQLAAYLASTSGNLRQCSRASLVAARLARRNGDWPTWASSIDGAVGGMVSLGLLQRGRRIVASARRIVDAGKRIFDSGAVLMAEAQVEFAGGSLKRAQRALQDWDTLATAMHRPQDERDRLEPLRVLVWRFEGRAAEALDRLQAMESRMSPITRAWAGSGRLLSLMDVGAWRTVPGQATAHAEAYRQWNDPIGEGWMCALEAQAWIKLGDLERARHRLSCADGMYCDDRLLAGWCAGVRGMLEIAQGRGAAAETCFLRAVSLLAGHELMAREMKAQGVVALVGAGAVDEARRLAGGVVHPPSESPLVEVLESVAAALLEPIALGALRRLKVTAAASEVAGGTHRILWLRTTAEVALRAGDDALAERCRKGAREESERLEEASTGNGWEPTEKTVMEASRLAAQARQIQDIVREVNAELNLGRLLNRVLDAALSLSGAERGFIILNEGTSAQIRASRPQGDSPEGAGSDTFSNSVAQQVLRTGTTFLSRDATLDDRLEGAASVRRLQVRSALCMPFRLRGRLLGVFYLDNLSRANVFEPAAVDTLQTLSDLASVAIENARLFEENEAARVALEKEAAGLREKLEAVDRERQREEEGALKYPYPTIVGRSVAMLKMLRQADRATDLGLPVLIGGDTGTGKELVARAIHAHGPVKRGPFEAVNCAAISPQLMESELFGHNRGSFTGATSDHEGLFRRGDGGTVFLDEVGDLDLGLQAKLLRVLEDGVVRPVGSDKSFKVKVRVIAATNRNLKDLVQRGKFREDLYFRLACIRIEIPHLRDRVEDIPALVRRFLQGHGEFTVEPGAMRMLMKADWRGNVRQLKHFVDILSAASRDVVRESDVRELLAQESRGVGRGEEEQSLSSALDRVRAERVRGALVDSSGNLAEAARKLGVTYQGLRKMVLKYQLSAFWSGEAAATAKAVKRPKKRLRRGK